MIFAEFLMNRNSRRVFFDEMIDFTIRKRYFGGRVRKERSGRPPREKKRIQNVLIDGLKKSRAGKSSSVFS